MLYLLNILSQYNKVARIAVSNAVCSTLDGPARLRSAWDQVKNQELDIATQPAAAEEALFIAYENGGKAVLSEAHESLGVRDSIRLG